MAESNVPAAVIQKHFREIHNLAEEGKRIASELTTAFKRAKADGVPIDALKMARKLGKMDSDDAAQLLKQMAYCAAALGMPFAAQLEMFGTDAISIDEDDAQAHREWLAAEAGHKAGLDGEIRSANPYKPGSEDYVTWDVAWIQGDKKRFDAAKASGSDKKKPRGRKSKDGEIVPAGQPVLIN